MNHLKVYKWEYIHLHYLRCFGVPISLPLYRYSLAKTCRQKYSDLFWESMEYKKLSVTSSVSSKLRNNLVPKFTTKTMSEI